MISSRFSFVASLGLIAGFLHCAGAPGMAAEAEKAVALKGGEGVRATADQMHQLDIAKVRTFPFRAQRHAIGRIAYNDDASTPVLTPFSGRVTRLIAWIRALTRRWTHIDAGKLSIRKPRGK